jgi:hypothetical protein
MISYQDFNHQEKPPNAIPVAYAFDIAGTSLAGYIITIAATVEDDVLMVMDHGQSCIS